MTTLAPGLFSSSFRIQTLEPFPEVTSNPHQNCPRQISAIKSPVLLNVERNKASSIETDGFFMRRLD